MADWDFSHTTISTAAFRKIQALFREESGISLSSGKQALVASRLQKRLAHLKLKSFDDYCDFLGTLEGAPERRVVTDLLTTNETYFFREPEHFRHLLDQAFPRLPGHTLRIWCAGVASGEEAYSVAMALAERHGLHGWEIVGSDLSSRMVQHAQRGVYTMLRLQNLPEGYLQRYCLKGTGDHEGYIQIKSSLRDRITFTEQNLLDRPSALGKFDVIFMRNVLIYFSPTMKQQLISNALEALPSGGWFYTSHSESLNGLTLPLVALRPSIHRKT